MEATDLLHLSAVLPSLTAVEAEVPVQELQGHALLVMEKGALGRMLV